MTEISLAEGVRMAGQQFLQLKTRQVICAQCRKGAAQSCKDTRVIEPKYETGNWPKEESVFEKLWSCDFCNGVTLELIRCAEVPAGHVGRKILEVVQVWPVRAPRELGSEVPEPIRDRFREGSVCEGAGAYRGAAAMYRAAVEELCKERGATQTKLYHRIEGLRDQLDDELIQDLHEARVLGNDSLHDGLVYAPDEVADVAKLIEEMTEILYVQPARKAAMREARRQRRDASRNGEPAAAAEDATGQAAVAG